MTGLEIGALIAMLAGTAIQYKSNTDAAKRAQEQTLRSLANQDGLNRKAEKKALDQAQEFNIDDRKNEQQQIEQQLAQEFIAPVDSAQAINSQVATTQGDVSNDYTNAKTASDLNVMKNARNLAGLMAKTTGAGRLRTNEAVRMADTAAGIDRLGNFARGQAGVDQLAIQNAARPNAGMQLAGGLLSGVGTMGLMGAFGGAAKPASEAGALGSGMYQTPVPTGIGAAPVIPQTSNLGTGFWGLNNSAVGKPIPTSFTW
ncbi:Hypothetical protein HEAR2269 [Herminiimonas arsenicoxydans]|uniref:Uncharacterized protein n=1 Tax=Herminiimonas arsenicoxydans TaxID=204773 RepID=A4G7B5_HERAR|nr:Hypothetical protein HEAR2269 [Herminiimonas arsenicoxydans]